MKFLVIILKFVKTLISKKRIYTFSLRSKEENEKDLLLVISEKVRAEGEREFVANKVRIYDESLFDFFKMIEEIKMIVKNEKTKK